MFWNTDVAVSCPTSNNLFHSLPVSMTSCKAPSGSRLMSHLPWAALLSRAVPHLVRFSYCTCHRKVDFSTSSSWKCRSFLTEHCTYRPLCQLLGALGRACIQFYAYTWLEVLKYITVSKYIWMLYCRSCAMLSICSFFWCPSWFDGS